MSAPAGFPETYDDFSCAVLVPGNENDDFQNVISDLSFDR